MLRLLADENFNGRILRALRLPGVIVALTDRPIGQVIEDLEILLLASEPEELDGQIRFLPL